MKGGEDKLRQFNKKGLSTVVTTLILVLLVIVAILIVWGVVSGILRGSSNNVTDKAKCLDVDVTATKIAPAAAACTVPAGAAASTCTIRLDRVDTNSATSADEVIVVFKDASGNSRLTSPIPISTLGPLGQFTITNPVMPTAGTALSPVDSAQIILRFNGNNCDGTRTVSGI